MWLRPARSAERDDALLQAYFQSEHKTDDVAAAAGAAGAAAGAARAAEMSPDQADAARRMAEEEAFEAECLAMGRAEQSPKGESALGLLPGVWAETIVALDMTQKPVRGGSILSYRVLVVIGNGQGAGAFGVGKAPNPDAATVRAVRDAKKNVLFVDRFKVSPPPPPNASCCVAILRANAPALALKLS